LHRSGKLQDGERLNALGRLAFLSQSWREILPADALRDCALNVLESYPLRPADSLQLAAALTWCEQRTARRTFVCGDERLSEAAASAGFSVLQI
jgi:predicted nucleic acid-binding protein